MSCWLVMIGLVLFYTYIVPCFESLVNQPCASLPTGSVEAVAHVGVASAVFLTVYDVGDVSFIISDAY